MSRLNVWRRPQVGLWNDLDRWFDDAFFRGGNELVSSEFSPPVDLKENKDHYLLSFDVPGLSKKEVNVQVENNVLTVSGERKWESEDQHDGWSHRERRYGKFSRAFRLPDGVKSESIEAVHKDGVLSIAVPKAEARKAKEIEVREGSDGFFKKWLNQKNERVAS